MKSGVIDLRVIVFSLFLLIIISSCSKNNPDIVFIDRATAVVDTLPKQSLILLDSIKYPEELPKKEYMRYIVLKTQAKYKDYQDIKNDTLIYDAAKYYNKHIQDPYSKAIANLYASCVYSQYEIYAEAMEHLLEAHNNAKQTNDVKLNALINVETGKLYYKQNLPDSAVTYYKRALELYKQLGNTLKQQAGLMHLIAINYSINKEFDESLYYNKKALQLAQEVGDEATELRIRNSLGVVYRYIGNHKASKNEMLKILTKKSFSAPLKYNVYLNLSKSYLHENKLDSAFYYIELVEPVVEEKDDYFKISFHKYLAELHLKKGNYLQATEHQMLYHDYRFKVSDKEKAEALVQAEKEYQLSEKEKQLVSSRLKNQIFLSVALGCFLLLAIAVIFIVIFRSKHKRVIHRNELLDTQMNNILFVNDMYKYITNESNNFEKEVESLSLSYSIKEKSKGYSQIQTMLKNMKKETQENLRNSSMEFLKSKSIDNEVINKLNSSDMLLISLTQCKYDFKDIAIILGTNPHALHMRKQRLIEKLKKGGVTSQEIYKILS